MPTKKPSERKRQRALKEIACVEKYLRAGFPPVGVRGDNRIASATRQAAAEFGEPRASFIDRVGSPTRKGLWHRLFGMEPDWRLYRGEQDRTSTLAQRTRALAPAEARTVRRFLLTAAQDETAIHQPFWQNLQAYARHHKAEIFVGGFTYQKGLFEDHAVRSGVFASELVPHLRAEIVELGPRILWYGRANILPTATDPLTGWDTATKDKWAVFPHAKIALKCVPVMPNAPGKQIMTTGVATRPNYIQRNSGQKAEFHHTIGATIVEVCPDGIHFCRQLSANTRDGSFQDLDLAVRDGKVIPGQTIEAVTWGDVHREFLDPDVAAGAWGYNVETDRCDIAGSILDTLKPAHSFIHDSFNFTARSHHTRNDPHQRVMRRAEKRDEVEPELRLAARFLGAVRRPFAQTVHVASNHNEHLHRWLKDESAFRDPVNAAYWCELNAATLRAAERGDEEFLIHEHALRRAHQDGLDGVLFLRRGQSYVICQATAPIECGLHADIGPRGVRGSAVALAKTVERINGAHTHEPGIREAVYLAGTSSLLGMKFNETGQGAWHHADIISYAAGKRAIVTKQGRRWRA
jgi:hypothetical protein